MHTHLRGRLADARQKDARGRLQIRTRLSSPLRDKLAVSVSQPVIRVAGLRKQYGGTLAVNDVSFDVHAGEIFGLIGPNGAGKTTTMECVEGLRAADSGAISVLGLDPARDAYLLQQRIGVQLQEAQLQKRIKVREAVAFWASLYRMPMNGDRLIEQLGLSGKSDDWF